MDDRVEPFDILRAHPAHVFSQGERPRTRVVVKPAIAVKAAIHPDNVKPLLQKRRPEYSADITIDTGHQYPHSRHIHLVKRSVPEISKICDATLRISSGGSQVTNRRLSACCLAEIVE